MNRKKFQEWLDEANAKLFDLLSPQMKDIFMQEAEILTSIRAEWRRALKEPVKREAKSE